MSCLSIGFPHLRPVIRASNIAEPEINSACGIGSGYRHNLIRSEDAVTLWFVDFDFGSIFAPDYLFIAKLALTPGITAIGIETSTDNITYTGVWSTSSITYQGNNNQDFFVSFPPINPPGRYWRVAFTASPATIVKLSKVYLGNLFTFEKHVSVKTRQSLETRDKNTFVTTSGRTYKARSTKRLNSWDVVINNLTDANLYDFVKKILDIEKRYVVLYDSSESLVFNEQPVWHGIIGRVRFEKNRPNLNSVSFDFREMA